MLVYILTSIHSDKVFMGRSNENYNSKQILRIINKRYNSYLKGKTKYSRVFDIYKLGGCSVFIIDNYENDYDVRTSYIFLKNLYKDILINPPLINNPLYFHNHHLKKQNERNNNSRKYYLEHKNEVLHKAKIKYHNIQRNKHLNKNVEIQQNILVSL
jgi:hypothetical protein